MCGIAGIARFGGPVVDCDALRGMSEDLRHRGPDDLGYLGWTRKDPPRLSREPSVAEGARVALAHRRLSILDLTEAAWQPMAGAGARHFIVFNGEIYNYRNLREELQKLGHKFNSSGDTEVLLAAYAQWGVSALRRLMGMFAFAVLDTQARKLFLARDFFGIKPLYYMQTEESFAFASEIPPLLRLLKGNRRANPARLYDYLRFGRTDHGGETMLAEVRQLPAAHYMEVDLDDPKPAGPVEYWRPEVGDETEVSFGEAAARLRELFLENIKLHLQSDVPVGAALSGGIDSSAIVGAMRKVDSSLDIRTFSYVADDPSINEEKWVDEIVRSSGARASKTRLAPGQLAQDLSRLMSVQGEPFGSTSIYAQYAVFRSASESGIKVMLDGQGGDELFGGYSLSLAARLASLVRSGRLVQAFSFLRRTLKYPTEPWVLSAGAFLIPCALQGPLRWLVGKDAMPGWLNQAWFQARGVAARFPAAATGQNALKKMLLESLRTMSLPMLLRYEDRNSMGFSVESRVPFLTPALMEFAFSLPEEYLVAQDGTRKAVLREAMKGIVPDSILSRRDKIGFVTPERAWLMAYSQQVEEILSSEAAARVPALNISVIRTEWQKILREGGRPDSPVWRWINLISWVRSLNVVFE